MSTPDLLALAARIRDEIRSHFEYIEKSGLTPEQIKAYAALPTAR